MNNLKSLTVSLAIVFFSQTIVLAQNPLRAAQQDQFGNRNLQNSRNSNDYYDARTQHRSELDYTRGRSTIDRIAKHELYLPVPGEPVRHDPQVTGASFEEIPKQGLPGGENQSGSTNLLGSATDGQWQEPQRILDLIMKISLNLVFVLSFAVGVILIAKKWVKPNAGNSNNDRAQGDSLSVRETLKIDSRISIRLVQWRSNRFLVACDQNGIQSVNTVSASFDQTLKELDDDPIDENIIRKLLENLGNKQG